jgi:dihydrodipicolinate synthase/N-acetylneuraminate lyase
VEGALRSLPGGDLVEDGIRDLGAGIDSAAALLVSSFASRLRRGGIEVPAHVIPDPEHRLYHLLAANDAEAAHGRYNALVRRMVSFARALECGS